MSDIPNNDLTLDALREELAVEQPKSPYERFFLLSNPFPAVGQFIPGICVNQEIVKREFARMLREFYLTGQSRRMTIVGRTGAGKTNLLKFFEQQLKEWRRPSDDRRALVNLFTIFIDSPQGSYFEIHRQIISQLGALFFPRFH
jgi:ATPase subunit of ABC transporter with duplicated ATPase domains